MKRNKCFDIITMNLCISYPHKGKCKHKGKCYPMTPLRPLIFHLDHSTNNELIRIFFIKNWLILTLYRSPLKPSRITSCTGRDPIVNATKLWPGKIHWPTASFFCHWYFLWRDEVTTKKKKGYSLISRNKCHKLQKWKRSNKLFAVAQHICSCCREK